MGRLRYIGSKARVVDAILQHVGPPNGGKFVDVFSGTGVVSRAALLRGWHVCANDFLFSSMVTTEAGLMSASDAQFRKTGGYEKTIATLNSVPEVEGFTYREYSSSGQSTTGEERLYFTERNAGKIDGIREQIRLWSDGGKLREREEHLLLADLLAATNLVANIAGTYGCFLSKLTDAARRNLTMVPRPLHGETSKFEVSCLDSFGLSLSRDDTAYIDPPYTKRQYASYYHLLETIAYGDEPDVVGVSGLRPWQEKSSPFCYKRKAAHAFDKLIRSLGAGRVLVSYSCSGQVPIDELETVLGAIGSVRTIPLAEIGKYRPNTKASSNGDAVSEFLFEVLPQPKRRDG